VWPPCGPLPDGGIRSYDVLPVIGLALDLVGAASLVIGLFRPPRPLFPGWSYAPDDAARDAAFGAVGVTLLGAGFALQAVPYFGFSPDCGATANAIAAVTALLLAVVYAWAVYGSTFLIVLDRKRREGVTKVADGLPG
jgi:hypothetical protein